MGKSAQSFGLTSLMPCLKLFEVSFDELLSALEGTQAHAS
jgi:hypothetical protein